jgi:hypothetical protein
MLGPVLVADPPPGSALRLLAVTRACQLACSTAVRSTATGSPDPSVDGAGAGHGQLVQAGYPVSWGSRAVWAPALRFCTSTSKIAFSRRSSLNPDRPYKAAAPRRGTQDQAAYVWVGLIRKRRRLILRTTS